MPDTTAFAAGDMVRARPWVGGRRLPLTRGIVVAGDGDDMPADRTMIMVWFQELGSISDAGRAFQPVLRSGAAKITRNGLGDWTPDMRANVLRTLHAAREPFTSALCRALEAFQRGATA
jgi:Family of unknown function (DUF6409)